MKLIIVLLYVVVSTFASGNEVSSSPQELCVPSLTTASGSYAPTGTICQNTLIFNENFNNFDTRLWSHELSMWGGGVRTFCYYHIFDLSENNRKIKMF